MRSEEPRRGGNGTGLESREINSTLPETNSKFAPGNRLNPKKGKRSYSNHPFSGAFAVRFREGKLLIQYGFKASWESKLLTDLNSIVTLVFCHAELAIRLGPFFSSPRFTSTGNQWVLFDLRKPHFETHLPLCTKKNIFPDRSLPGTPFQGVPRRPR